MPQETVNYLEDIEVDTVGLVDKGAVGVFGNGRNFFLFKKLTKEVNMTGQEILEALARMLRDDQTPPPDPAPDDKEEPPVEKKDLTALLTKSQELITAQQSQLAELSKRVEAAETAVNESKAELAKRELEAAQKIFIEKAQGWPNVARQPVALGKALHAASIALEPEMYQLIEDTFAGSDELLKAAGAWAEFGSTEIPDDGTPLAKAQRMANEQNIPLAEALLKLPKHEQEAIRQGVQ